jgi:2,3-dihydroxy-2,3-dihydrophenylpropionate dehydrogenase
MMEVSELAELYLFLASEHARGLTGEVLRPDGGLSIRTGAHHDFATPTGRKGSEK